VTVQKSNGDSTSSETARTDRRRPHPAELSLSNVIYDETGAIGYIVLWILGVPAGLLFIVFLMRGCT